MSPEVRVADILAPVQAALAQTALELAQTKAELRAAQARLEFLVRTTNGQESSPTGVEV